MKQTVCDYCGAAIEKRPGHVKVEDQTIPNHWEWWDFCNLACAVEYLADTIDKRDPESVLIAEEEKPADA